MPDHVTPTAQLLSLSGFAEPGQAVGTRRMSPRVDGMTPFEVIRLPVVLVLAGLLGCRAQESPRLSDAPADVALADTLKSLIEQAYDFSRPGVVERMNGLYPDTGRAISASGGQVIASADSIRAGIADFWRDAGSNMREARWEWGQVYLDRLSPAAAVLTATWAIPHIAPTGRPHVIRGAWTAVFRRQAGEWKIVVEHLSVPPT